MSYRTETQQVSAQFVNSSFVRKITDGHIKEAAAEGSAFIRDHVRQESYAREILVPVLLQDDEIDRDENTDEPKKIVEKEPNSSAVLVQFTGSAPRTWFKGPRYSVFFGKTESQHFTKSKFQLMTYVNDIRKILSDNAVKDMADQEDKKFQDTVDYIVGANAAVQITTASSFSSTPFKKGFQALVGRRRPIGKMLMCKGLYYEALDLPATSVGNDVATGHYKDGIEQEERLWGFPVVTTIKNDVLNAKKAYIFAPDSFLGASFMLQDATLYIQQKADLIEFWAYSAIGSGIGNSLSIQELDFTAI